MDHLVTGLDMLWMKIASSVGQPEFQYFKYFVKITKFAQKQFSLSSLTAIFARPAWHFVRPAKCHGCEDRCDILQLWRDEPIQGSARTTAQSNIILFAEKKPNRETGKDGRLCPGAFWSYVGVGYMFVSEIENRKFLSGHMWGWDMFLTTGTFAAEEEKQKIQKMQLQIDSVFFANK